MRYLNKIVFINSAHIRYEEVMLDGNVHFIGTQGVGKSTLLRAILFFYNANKLQLGIQPGQKSFDEFYFEKSNSYIVYEVMRETGAYSILLDRFQGKATFFFIDAPYDRNWFVEEDGNVPSEWITIRNRIGKGIDVTGRIETYEVYRNIIFGNTHDSKHRYDKFAIAESSKYQNIPRSIQNVFLNSKLDAEFVRDTIIQSMTDVAEEGQGINLATYRHQLEDFENEYNDISLWFEKDKDGNYPVRMQADRTVDAYQSLRTYEKERMSLWHKLNYAVRISRQTLPKLASEMATIEEKIAKLKAQLAEIDDKYDAEMSTLNRELGALESKLKEIAHKRKRYHEIGIESALLLADQEGAFLSEKSRLENIRASLLKDHEDITEKFTTLFDKLSRSKDEYEQNRRKILNDKRESMMDVLDALRNEEKELLSRIDEKYSTLLKESDERLNSLHSEKNRCEGLIRDLRTWHPKETEIKACNDEILECQKSEAEVGARLETTKSEIERLRAESLKEQSDLEHLYQQNESDNRRELDNCKAELSKVEDLLGGYEDSLYQWLETNRPGWQENIGKVVDENKVLYAKGLTPELTGEANGLFGVKIDLGTIESTLRTPDEYREIKAEYEEKVAELRKTIESDALEKEKKLTALSKRFGSKTSELRQTKSEQEILLSQFPHKIKTLTAAKYKLEQEEKGIIEETRVTRQQSLDMAMQALQRETESRYLMDVEKQREQKAVSQNIADRKAAVDGEYEQLRLTTEREIAENAASVDLQRQEYEREQEQMLKGKGVDISIIAKNQSEINEVDAKLNLIKEQSQLVYDYRKDKRELFDKEESFCFEKSDIESKLNLLKQKYTDTRQKTTQEREESEHQLSSINEKIKSLKEGIQEAERYSQVENDIPTELISDISEKETNEPCQSILSSLRGCVNRIRNRNEELKRSVTQFVSRFSVKNTFNFKLNFPFDEDYRTFSENLQEFLSSNMIEEYRRRTNVHYDDILRRIAKEVGYVMKGTSRIKEIIAELNRDFKERNFAGVIKSIELRPEDTSNKLMQMFLSIKEFTDEYIFTLGEINLFSGDNRDEVNVKAVDLLVKLMKLLQKESSTQFMGIAETFRLQFRVRENDNDTGWVERISNVGSDGTDILVKAMINIMLINVFKDRASRKFGEFKVHCMMDEIGKLHPNNIKGILQFANSRNILLVNSSPTTNNPYDYKYTYTLSKDVNSYTHIMLTLKTIDDGNI